MTPHVFGRKSLALKKKLQVSLEGKFEGRRDAISAALTDKTFANNFTETLRQFKNNFIAPPLKINRKAPEIII